MIRGILLDVYGTVVEEDDDVIRAISEEIAAQAPSFPATADHGFRHQRGIVIAALERVLAEVGSGQDSAQACERQFDYWREPAMRPGSAEFVERCPVPICVVSNIDRDEPELAATGVSAGPIAVAAVALLSLGGVLMIARRRAVTLEVQS